MVITQANAGTSISLFDSPVGSHDDDYTIVKIKKDITNPVTIGTFEKSYEDDFVRVSFFKDDGWFGIGLLANGLDGKVSLVKIDGP